MAARPRITFLADRPRWAQARTARAISRYLADEFECRVVYATDEPNLRAWPCDLLHVGSWDGSWHRRFEFERHRLVKSVTNHRWEDEGMSAEAFAAACLDDAGTVTCCSERLLRSLAPHRDVHLTPMGFDPFVFPGPSLARGPLRVGWAGDRNDTSKGLDEVLRPAVGDAVELRIAGGGLTLAQMGDFFRSIDVIAVTSRHDGAPLTLVEALASGCFPICTDVGVVPELIADGENGLVVARDPAAFREALEWCHANPETVRRVGRRNAETMRHRRTWEHVADRWRDAFWAALDARSAAEWLPRPAPPAPKVAVDRALAAPVGQVERIALLSRHYDSGALDDQIVELATRRLVGDRHIERGPSERAPNEPELERLRECDVAVVCGGDLARLAWSGALAPGALQRLGLPVVALGVRCSDGARVEQELRELAGYCRGVGTLDDGSRAELERHGLGGVATVGSPALIYDVDEEIVRGGGPPVVVLHGSQLSSALDEICDVLDPILLVSDVQDFRTAARLVRRHGVRTIVRGDHLARHLAAARHVLSLRAPQGMLALALGADVVFAGGDPDVEAVRSLLGSTEPDESQILDAVLDPGPGDGRVAGAIASAGLALRRVLAAADLAARETTMAVV